MADPADSCGHCGHCGRTSVALKRCSRCLEVSYCGRECQVAAWKAEHKSVCVEASDAAEPASNDRTVVVVHGTGTVNDGKFAVCLARPDQTPSTRIAVMMLASGKKLLLPHNKVKLVAVPYGRVCASMLHDTGEQINGMSVYTLQGPAAVNMAGRASRALNACTYVGQSPGRGDGLFASQMIPEGTMLCETRLLLFQSTSADECKTFNDICDKVNATEMARKLGLSQEPAQIFAALLQFEYAALKDKINAAEKDIVEERRRQLQETELYGFPYFAHPRGIRTVNVLHRFNKALQDDRFRQQLMFFDKDNKLSIKWMLQNCTLLDFIVFASWFLLDERQTPADWIKACVYIQQYHLAGCYNDAAAAEKFPNVMLGMSLGQANSDDKSVGQSRAAEHDANILCSTTFTVKDGGQDELAVIFPWRKSPGDDTIMVACADGPSLFEHADVEISNVGFIALKTIHPGQEMKWSYNAVGKEGEVTDCTYELLGKTACNTRYVCLELAEIAKDCRGDSTTAHTEATMLDVWRALCSRLLEHGVDVRLEARDWMQAAIDFKQDPTANRQLTEQMQLLVNMGLIAGPAGPEA